MRLANIIPQRARLPIALCFLAFGLAVACANVVIGANLHDKVIATVSSLLTGLLLSAVFAVLIHPVRSTAPGVADALIAPFIHARPRTRLYLVGALLVLLLLVARFVLDAFPNSGDEYAYVLQAKTYAQGRLWVPAPPLHDAFGLTRFKIKDEVWISIYQPGWAVVLTPAAWLGLPLWIVNPVIGVALIAAFFRFARLQMSPAASWAATLALASSAFFIFNAASYFSHTSCALWGVLFALFGWRYLEKGEAKWAILAGMFLGALGFARAFNAIVFAAPFIVALAMKPGRRVGLLWFVLGGLPFLAALLAFNTAVTGDPLMMVAQWSQRYGEPLGAPSSKSLKYMFAHVALLAVWTSPILLVGLALAFVSLARRRALIFSDFIFPLTLLAFFFYAAGAGNEYGPRYYFEAFPFAVLTAVRALDGTVFGSRGTRGASIIATALLAHIVYQLGFLGPCLYVQHKMVFEREDLFREVKRAKLSNAVVIVAATTPRWGPFPAQDLLRNGLHVGDEPVVYAKDLREHNGEIRALFPSRKFYRYEDGVLSETP